MVSYATRQKPRHINYTIIGTLIPPFGLKALRKYDGFGSNFRPQAICGMHRCSTYLALYSINMTSQY